MLKLIFQNLEKRRIQAVSTFFAVLLSVAVLFALLLLYNGVSKGIATSQERMGADLIVVPSGAEELIAETDLLFTGAPATLYMKTDVTDVIADIDGVTQTTVQFYGQTLGSSCCSTGAERRIIGYDAGTDWIVQPWADQKIGRLKSDEVIVGSDVGGFESGEGSLLGHKMKLAAVLEPSGTSLDSSILMDINTARGFSEELKGYEHFWKKYGKPESLISAVLVKTSEGRKNAIANLIELKGDYTCIVSSNVLGDIQNQMHVVFMIMLGAGILLCLASVFQLFARFYSMAWDRKAELGLYRAMGATEKNLRMLILGEASLLTGGGALIGVISGAGLYWLVLRLMTEEAVFPFLTPSFATVVLGVVAMLVFALLIGYLAVIVPLRQISRIDPAMAMQKYDID